MPTVTELRPVRGRPSLQGRVPARRGLADHLREPVPPGGTGQRRRGLGGVASRGPTSPASVAREPSPCSATPSSRRCSGGPSSRWPRLARSWRSATARPRTDWVRPDVPQTSAWCSVDLALLDAFGRASGEPVSLGGRPPAADALRGYRYSGVVSAGRGWPYAVSLLKMRAFRFPHVKLKVEQDGAEQAARTARRLLGRRVDLRVDANMAWDVEQALRGHRPAASGRDPVVRAADPGRTTWPAWPVWWPSRGPGSWSTRA